ncbi:MAG TPA: hypothetical protein VGQ41_15515 [Pyrinomonadaceae bacterium]|jgi:hypothetical protein|nr:hypothetical protein [Pyrinomonadaceae bacterium]
MVTLLITSVFVLGLLAIVVYFWQKAANTSQPIELPLPPPPTGLFSDFKPAAELPSPTEDPKKVLIENAVSGDKNALEQAHALNDSKLYEEVLDILVAQIDSAPKLLSLVSHITKHEFPVIKALARKSIDYWKDSLDRHSTAKMLHIAALSDDAEVYRQAVEVVLNSWRDGKLPDLSAAELQSLINGEFWVLSSNTRSSGAGFVLKRTVATAKRELEQTI